MMRALLRVGAILIAVAGLIDPVLSLERPVRPAMSIVAVAHQSPENGPMADDTARAATVDRLATLLGDDFDVSASRYVPSARAAACPGVGGCIVVTDGSLPTRLSDGATVIGAVHVADESAPRVAIVGLHGVRDAHLTAVSLLDVDLEASKPRGETTLRVFDGQAVVGRAVHKWSTGGTAGTLRETAAVEWVPLAPGPRRLRVVATPLDGAETHVGAEAETVVDVGESRRPVVLYEPEATWMGTFVRRALEADSRFQLAGRVQVAPAVAVTRGTGAMLRQESLRDALVVIVTAAERLSAGEVELLDRFARIRGGSVVLVPDAEITGPVARLVPSAQSEQVEERPQAVGVLRARDILSFQPGAGVTALASAGDRPVVVARAIGRGRIVASGALDAWRYREDGAFDRFWTSVIADAAAAAGSTVSVRMDHTLLEPGESTNVHVEWRSLDQIPSSVRAEAVVDCSGDRQPIRLWSDGRVGSFSGSVEALRTGSCDVSAIVGDITRPATTSFITAPNIRRSIAGSRELDRAIRAAGGSVVGPSRLESLAARARESLEAGRERQDTRPMHSPWWVVPFAACLGGEWLLRRRAGLR